MFVQITLAAETHPAQGVTMKSSSLWSTLLRIHSARMHN